ncbi:hypothetical protein Tco_0669771, partial [Tanacetum coccineum]
MLAPRSAKALHEKVLLKVHGIRKLPGSLSLGGTLFWIISELSSLRNVDEICSSLKRISDKRTKNQAKTDKTEHGMEKRGKDKVKSKPKSTKVKVNPDKVKAKKSSNERVFPTVVDWRTSAPKDERPAVDSYSTVDVATLNLHQMDLFNLINAPNPLKVKTGARPRLSHEVPLLTATASRVINMENTPATSEDETKTQVPDAVAPEVPRAENPVTTEVVPELNLEKEAAAMGPPLNKRRRKRDKGEAEANAPPKPQPPPEQDIAQSSKKAAAAEDPDSEKSISFTSMGGPPEDIYQPGWGVTNNCRLDTPEACQDMVDHIVPPGFEQEAKLLKKAVARVARRDQRIQAREVEIKNLEALLEAEADMKKVAEAKNAELSKVKSREKKKIKAAFEEFKKYEDDRVTSRCVEIDARLDALSIDFDEELYPHMLTMIAGHRWVIGHGLRLAVMKCTESMELRRGFAK